MTKDEIKVLTPIGMLGYGIPQRFLKMGAEMAPDVIAVDAGSTDSGPQKLGLGDMTCSRQAYERDIAMLLEVGMRTRSRSTYRRQAVTAPTPTSTRSSISSSGYRETMAIGSASPQSIPSCPSNTSPLNCVAVGSHHAVPSSRSTRRRSTPRRPSLRRWEPSPFCRL